MAAVRALALVLCGAVLGAAGMRAYLAPRPAPAALPAAVAAAPAVTPRVEQGDAPATWVTLEDGIDARRVPAVVLAEPSVVVLRFADFVRAERAFWTDASGTRRLLTTAVAINLELGLLAFAHQAGGAGLPRLASDDGSLYLGLDVSVHTPLSVREAFVDSAAIEVGPDDYRYHLAGLAALDAPMAAVLDANDTLLGLATRAGDGQWQAMDAGTLRRFLDNALTPPLAPLSRVVAQVFDAPLGIAREFDALAAAGRYAATLDAARALFERAPQLLTPTRIERVHEALERQLRALITTQRSAIERGRIDADLARFGASTPVLEYVFDIHAAADGLPATIESFVRGDRTALARVEPALRTAVLREKLLNRIAGPEASQASAIELLETALAGDADYAPYHRALGDLLFRRGVYDRAAFHLRRAGELEPAMRAELERMLVTAQQRRQITDAVEIPIETRGSALYVPVQINGGQTFRFVLDTGASYSAINTRTLLLLGYSNIFNQGAPVIELETANGRVFAPTFQLPSMSVGGATVEQVPVVILEDMGPLDGLLGLSFLKHFDVQIDAGSERLVLRPR